MGTGVTIAARGLAKSFDGGLVRALKGGDLEVAAGERVAIMGPTGCGKSTLLGLLALLDTPDSGELRIDGLEPAALGSPEAWRAASVGIVFQLHHLRPHLSVEENVLLPLQGRARRSSERSRALLDGLGLAGKAHTLAAKLSGGERQLAAVARALVNEPRLVLADEPTGSVDTATGERILETLLGWCGAQGATLVVVTHDATVAARLQRRVHMRDGVVA
jgi:putative ABC transport system ATP-binding protein